MKLYKGYHWAIYISDQILEQNKQTEKGFSRFSFSDQVISAWVMAKSGLGRVASLTEWLA